MKFIVCTLVILALLCPTDASNYDLLFNQTLLNMYQQCYADLNENFIVYFTVRETDVDFAISGATAGWVGFGLGNRAGGLTDVEGDPMVGYVASDGRIVIHDYYIESQTPCNAGNLSGVCGDTVFGGSDDVSNLNGWESNGFTTLVFTRPIIAVNPLYDLAISNSTAYFMVAFGQTDDVLTPHTPNAQFHYRMNLYYPDSVGPQVRCANNCGGTRGTCVRGCCVCAQGYGGVQCSNFIGGNSSDQVSSSSGPSKGTIAAVILGTLLALLVIVAFVAWIRRKQAKRQKKTERN